MASAPIVSPLSRNGPSAESGWKSRYCSPTGDNRLRTLTRESFGISVPALMLAVARTPSSVGTIVVTLPTLMPR